MKYLEVFAIVGETHQPETKDEHHEKYRIDNSHEFQANFLLKILVSPGISVFLRLPPGLALSLRSLSECLDVGLHEDVHEGFEEAEDEPAVDHLDVGGGGEVGAHAHTLVFSKYKS